MQGLLELAGVPYVGAGVAASALCMDKDLFKCGAARPRHPGDAQRHAPARRRAANPYGYPVFVKPARLGSSVGISKAHDDAELERRGRARLRARREGARRGVRRRDRGRGRRARQPAARGVAPGRDRGHAQRVVRLRGQVRRRRDGARRPGAHLGRAGRRARRSSRSARSSRPSARAWRASTCSSAATARCSSTS